MKLFFILLLLLFINIINSEKTCDLLKRHRTSCGHFGIKQTECEDLGCCWDNSIKSSCYKKDDNSLVHYEVTNIEITDTGYHLDISKNNHDFTTDDIINLKMDVYFETNTRLHIKINDNDVISNRWEIPDSVISRPNNIIKKASNPTYNISFIETPFSFKIIRNNNNQILFDSSIDSFIFKDQKLEISTIIDENAFLYGLGESSRNSLNINNGDTHVLWNEDLPSSNYDKNLYGSHPFLLQMVNGKAHGILFLNSNGMKITYNDGIVTFMSIGGIFDIYIFTGESPADVVSQYTEIVGKPTMQPYWSLGFHNCRWGYENLDEIKDVVANYDAANLNLDTQWVDIDYMDAWKDFTLDPINFPQNDFKSFVDNLHKDGKHFIPIIDPGIYILDNNYETYLDGIQSNIFIKDINNQPFIGQVWPGPTYFPDWFNPDTQDWWTKQFQSFWDMINWDGIWIDMNEVSNFCNPIGIYQTCNITEKCYDLKYSPNCCLTCEKIDSDNKYDFPPYSIDSTYKNLGTKTMPMSAYHYNNILEYDVHNLYGLMESIATKNAVQDIRGERSFVLTRSTFASTGHHVAHWTGDNSASWDDLKYSISTILTFSLSGINFVGADICGFTKDSNEELCARWAEVGAFYPFSRNHNTKGTDSQEFYLWESVTKAAQNAYGLRYKLLPYLYTTLWNSHIDGSMVARPLFVNFPDDSNVLNIATQWMLGDAIMISPVLDQGYESVDAYFPQGKWYSLFDDVIQDCSTKACSSIILDTPLTSTNVHVLGGNIIPMQQNKLTTTEARITPFTLLIALPSTCTTSCATGSLFLDDGIELDVDSDTAKQTEILYNVDSGIFTSTLIKDNYDDASTLTIESIVILGVEKKPTSILLSVDSKQYDLTDSFTYDEDLQKVIINIINDLFINQEYTIYWN